MHPLYSDPESTLDSCFLPVCALPPLVRHWVALPSLFYSEILSLQRRWKRMQTLTNQKSLSCFNRKINRSPPTDVCHSRTLSQPSEEIPDKVPSNHCFACAIKENITRVPEKLLFQGSPASADPMHLLAKMLPCEPHT